MLPISDNTLTNQLKFDSVQVANTKMPGAISWSREEQQTAKLIRFWHQDMSYQHNALRNEGFRWKLVDSSVEAHPDGS